MSDILARLSAALADRYRIERQLGAGGMATVYLAEDLERDRQVAIKVLHPEVLLAIGPERFRREVTIASRLQHPNILPVFDSGAVEGLAWYVMPYVEGESLRDRLNKEGQLSLDEAMRIATEVAEALGAAHAAGYIHRDIKPENILLSGGHAVVADFGIARPVGEAAGRLTETGLLIGTPTYMSPEQGSGDPHLDGRSDLYTLGCVLYEMLAGTPPFHAPTPQGLLARHALDPVPPLHTIRPGTPPGVEAIVERLLAKNPADRYPTAGALVPALRDAPRAPIPLVRRRPGRKRWPAVLVGGAGLLVAIWLWQRGAPAIALRQNLLAVAAFEIADSSLAPLRNAMGDMLTSALDGAGPLRTVSMRRVLEASAPGSDVEAGVRLGSRTGASLVVVGRLLSAGQDSVLVRATLVDVAQSRPLGDAERSGPRERLDLWGDSLSLDLLRAVGQVRPLAAVRRGGLGTSSLPALKAYLQGEQYLRRGLLDSAQSAYDHAVQMDSSFILALKRQSETARARCESDPFAKGMLDAALRMVGKAQGLTGRDSAMVQLDSLNVEFTLAIGRNDHEATVRLHSLLLGGTERAVMLFPEDPEFLVYRGDALAGLANSMGERRAAFEAFTQAIAADSFYAAAYPGAIQTAAQTGRGKEARQLARRFTTLGATGSCAEGARLTGDLLPGGLSGSARSNRLTQVSGDALWAAEETFEKWPDSAETAIELIRVALARRLTPFPVLGDTLELIKGMLRSQLSFRGHLLAADSLDQDGTLLANAFVGALSPDSLSRRARFGLANAAVGEIHPFVLWWIEPIAAERDTASLRRFAVRLDSMTRFPPKRREESYPGQLVQLAATLSYARRYVSAAFTLARGDTTRGMDSLWSLPGDVCYGCFMHEVMLARLSARRGEYQEASRLYRRDFRYLPDARHVLWTLERAAVQERAGDRTGAREAYAFVTEAWANADPLLRHFVEDARAGLRRVS